MVSITKQSVKESEGERRQTLEIWAEMGMLS